MWSNLIKGSRWELDYNNTVLTEQCNQQQVFVDTTASDSFQNQSLFRGGTIITLHHNQQFT